MMAPSGSPDQEKRQVGDLTTGVDQEKSQNHNHEGHIQELNKAKDESQKQLAELIALLDQEKSQNHNHEEHIRALNEAKDENQKQLAELIVLLDQEKSQNHNHEEHIHELNAAKDDYEKQLTGLAASLRQQKEQNAALEGSNQLKDARISELESVLGDLYVLADGSASRDLDIDSENVKKVVVDAMDSLRQSNYTLEDTKLAQEQRIAELEKAIA
jgi:chromosome segregation ATPase